MQYRVNVSGSSETTWITTIAEGATVYLPVHVPRALLFIHDVQAMQGAGELTGNAQETLMEIEFKVDLQSGGSPRRPHMENTEYLMASGFGAACMKPYVAQPRTWSVSCRKNMA
jgi:acetamidase/formamidase